MKKEENKVPRRFYRKVSASSIGGFILESKQLKKNPPFRYGKLIIILF